jgi:hypothetical protein
MEKTDVVMFDDMEFDDSTPQSNYFIGILKPTTIAAHKGAVHGHGLPTSKLATSVNTLGPPKPPHSLADDFALRRQFRVYAEGVMLCVAGINCLTPLE